MPRKGENITKRRDGRYEARYVLERDEFGRIKRYGFVYARSYLEVKQKRNEKIKNIGLNKTNKNFNKQIFEDSIQLWLDYKISIKDSSYTNYYSIIHSKLIPFFKGKHLNNIDSKDIVEFTKYLQNMKLSSKRIKDILVLLKHFMEDNDKFVKFEMPKVSKKKIITLTDEELELIKNNVKNTNDVKVFAILFTLFTGVRIGELCALTWKDIDLDNKVIHITKTLIRVKNKDINSKLKTKLILDTPKTEHSVRDIPINDTILPYLKKFKKSDNFYFLTSSEQFITTKKYYFFYLNFLESLSIKKYKFHILRHTFATRSLLCGVDIKSLSEILGHSSVKITLDLYVHVKDNEKLFQINKLTFLNLS